MDTRIKPHIDAARKYGDARVRQGHSKYDIETAAAEAVLVTGLDALVSAHDARIADLLPKPGSAHNTPRDGGWYWVRYAGLFETFTAPALYNGESQTWHSNKFSGIPEVEVEVICEIAEPGAPVGAGGVGRLRSPAVPDETCRICFSDEPHTGTCGSDDPRALCNLGRAARAQTPACQHRIADARNPLVTSGYLRVDCGALFSAADHETSAAMEPVAYLHDDGCWTPAKTEHGRALSDRLIFAGAPKIGVHLHPTPSTTKAEPAPAAFGDEEHVLVPRALIGAACHAISEMIDSPKTLAELRRYAMGDLSKEEPDPLHCRELGEELLKVIEGNWTALQAAGWDGPVDSPTEVVVDLLNLLDEAKAAPADALDAERLNWLDENTCDLRCVSTSEDDYSWVVIEHYMAEPREREIGWGHTARAAIDAAIAAQAAQQEVK